MSEVEAFLAVYLLTVVILAGVLVDSARRQATERARLLAAVMSRTPADFVALTAERPARDDDAPADVAPLVGGD